MPDVLSPEVAKSLTVKLRLVARIAGGFVVVLSLLVLLGWALNVSLLKSALPGHIEMKANAALGFVLTGLSLFLQVNEPVNPRRQRLAQLLALAGTLLGLLTTIEYLFDFNLGIDQMLFYEPPNAFGGLLPGRMGVPAALGLTLLGTALLNMTDRQRLVQFLALVGALLGLMVLTGFAFGIDFLGIATYTRMSINGAVIILVLSIGILCAYPDRGLMAFVTANSLGGVVARKLLPVAVIVPLFIGWLQGIGERLGLWESAFGDTLFAVVTVSILCVLIWRNSVLLNQMDTQRKQALEQVVHLAAEQERMKALQRFINDVSHDFRTPLSIINTSSYLLRKVTDPERQQGYLDQIEQQTTRLTQQFDSLLDMSRLDGEVKSFTLMPTDIQTLVRNVIEECRPLAAYKDQYLRFENGVSTPPVPADRSELGRAITNLVMNALHFTPEKGVITVRNSVELPYVVIEVQDTGIGIAAEDLPHIFERFYRADKARQINTGGSGLGLAIVKKVVDHHGGLLEVTSVPGQGSIFRVKLPLHPLSGST